MRSRMGAAEVVEAEFHLCRLQPQPSALKFYTAIMVSHHILGIREIYTDLIRFR